MEEVEAAATATLMGCPQAPAPAPTLHTPQHQQAPAAPAASQGAAVEVEAAVMAAHMGTLQDPAPARHTVPPQQAPAAAMEFVTVEAMDGAALAAAALTSQA